MFMLFLLKEFMVYGIVNLKPTFEIERRSKLSFRFLENKQSSQMYFLFVHLKSICLILSLITIM